MKRSLFAKGTIVLTAFAATLFSYGTASALSYNIVGLGTLSDGGFSAGYGINDSGQVTGVDRHYNGFLYDGSSMQNIGTSGGAFRGYGINDAGHVTGVAGDDWNARAFIYDGSSMQNIGWNSFGMGINNSGQIAGYFYDWDYNTHAFLYDGTTMRELGTSSGWGSAAYGINNSGQVTGNLNGRAFLYDGTTMSDLGLSGEGYAINDLGQVTGHYHTAGAFHAFLYNGTSTQDLGTLGGTYSIGYGINDAGQVVGLSYTTGNSATHAFVYDGTSMIDLNSFLEEGSGWMLREARDINNSGQITGTGSFNGVQQAFIMTPFEEAPPVVNSVPEPSTFMLLASGLGGFAMIRRFRRK